MKITEETVDHIAHLARLEFIGDKKQAIQQDMEMILTFMEKLNEVDTEAIEPLIFMNTEVNKLREDIAIETIFDCVTTFSDLNLAFRISNTMIRYEINDGNM